ncbi:uncharacterized protein LOC121708916 [Alosa sapidissima]|uniref:uncharacterized protein LOC121708914 n=2 Tax=Alosa sapidissima TaxID=34773 RepID=UPI001C0905D3|nr:uncharacterized protein LOC121708914 [Alosa sapidissima]XP_041947809.1 uncharacterized protein LOC121708916 [Alosa sapidissima]
MSFHPVFRFEPSSSELTLRPSAAAEIFVKQGSASGGQVKRADVVRAEARARAWAKHGDLSEQAVLAESELQIGQHRGQTFQWLLSNNVGFAVKILASHQKEREGGDTTTTPQMLNKDALASYAGLYPPMVTAVARRRLCEGSLSAGAGLGDTLVGFGAHSHRTLKSLYDARDQESRTYVAWIRKQKVGARSRMEALKMYVLARDKEPKTAPEPAHVLPPPGASSSDPSDTELLAAAFEVDSLPPRTYRDAPPAAPPAVVPSSSLSSSQQPLEGPGVVALQQTASGKELLPLSWRQTLPEEQQEWVGRALFRRAADGKVALTTQLKLWWYPPGARPLYTQPPATAHAFFQRPFFLWMPYRMWAYHLTCPACGRKLMGAGLYRTVRRVLDRSGWYHMGTEYLQCPSCHKKVAGWSQDILEQLDIAHREQFPAVLTYKLSCDRAVIGLLKERTLGNGVARLRASLVEQHTREWMARSIQYLSVLRKLRAPGAAPQEVSLPDIIKVPGLTWLGGVYVREAMTRLDETRARVTSIFGDLLKMDSTKKIANKLAGGAAGSAAWVTNVGNEYGQVLVSVLTAAEGDGLTNMAAGLMERYRKAGKAPPKVMYVDRDCCVTVGTSAVHKMYHEWHELVVRLDVWHLMRRFARGVTTDSHQLYGLFMARLSFAIFEWDDEDVARLREAKQSVEGRDAHIKLSAKELARHCRRRTRGAAETERLLREVLDTFSGLTDTMGVPLIDRARMEEIWSTQRRHLDCIQDPEGVELYTKTGEVTKGGVRLPVFRCARGSTSLESFHLHQCRFIPGTTASDVHFQVYLLEGLVRWNEDRGRAAVEGGQRAALRCYSAQLQHSFNQLAQEFKGVTLVESYTEPREYTGELLGVEYLYSQTNAVLQDLGDPDAPDGTDEAEEEDGTDTDEGFQEEEEEEEPEEISLLAYHSALLQEPHRVGEASSSQSGPPHPPHPPPGDDRMEVQPVEEEEEDVVGPDGHLGYHHVVALAHALVELRHHAFVTQRQSREVVALWDKLADRDKASVTFPPRHQDKLVKGRFKTSNRHAHTPGVDSVKRVVLGQGAGAAQSPKASRLVEAIMLELCRVHSHEGTTLAGVRINRWGAVMRDYKQIQDNVVNCPALMASTRIQLFDVNQRTLSMWHNQRSKAMMRDTIAIAVPGPSAPQTAAEPLPAPRTLLQQPQQPDQPLQHRLPADASGLAATIRGPLAPELYDIIAALQSATSSSSSAMDTTPSAMDTTPSASDTQAPSSSIAAATAPAAAPAIAIAGAIPRSTAWRHKVQAEQERRAREEGLFLKPFKKVSRFQCRRCGQPKTREYGHSRYKRETFCARADGGTVEQWLQELKRREREGPLPPP